MESGFEVREVTVEGDDRPIITRFSASIPRQGITAIVGPSGSAKSTLLRLFRLQLVVMYMIQGGNAFAALAAGDLTVRRLFTADHQLVRSLHRVLR